VTRFLRQKKFLRGVAPEPLHAQRNSGTTTHANNITHTQHSPTCCFLCIQRVTGYIVNNPGQQCPWILYTKRTSQCSQILLMNLQHSSKCPPSSTILSFLKPCLSQSDIEYQYALSLNDKSGSSPEKLHSNCHNISLQLVLPTQYLNTIFVTIFLPYLHEWLPCIQLL
jgi:hypothetical protein